MKKISAAKRQMAELIVGIIVLTTAIFLFEILEYKMSFFKSFEIFLLKGILFIVIGSIFGYIYNKAFNKGYLMIQFMIFIFGTVIGLLNITNHSIFYISLSIYVGMDFYIVFSSYLIRYEFLKIIDAINKYSEEEKLLVIKNINLFYRHFLNEFESTSDTEDFLLYNYFNLISELLFIQKSRNVLYDLSISDAPYLEKGFNLIHRFMYEHKEFVRDDKKYFIETKDEDVDGHVVNYRWEILRNFEKFVSRWNIIPLTEPYYPPQKLELICQRNR